MLNQIILVGRITQDPKKIELENGKEKSIIEKVTFLSSRKDEDKGE